jgi:Arm DNA-binding domain
MISRFLIFYNHAHSRKNVQSSGVVLVYFIPNAGVRLSSQHFARICSSLHFEMIQQSVNFNNRLKFTVMLELLNNRFTFSLRTSHHNQDGKSAIVLRVSFRGERRDVFTGLYCFERDWDRSTVK